MAKSRVGGLTVTAACLLIFIPYSNTYNFSENINITSSNFLTSTGNFAKNAPNDEQRLLRYILRVYDRSVRPVMNASNTILVEIGLTLTQIFNINEKKQVLSTNVWLEQGWLDERITWDPFEFNNVGLLVVPARFLWTPDIVLLNNAEDFSHAVAQTNINVYPNGTALWAPPIQSHSTCKLDVTLFPFDQQICELRYASWIYDASQVDVTNRSHEINMDTGNYIENGEWHVVATTARRNVRRHAYYSVEYADVTFTLYLRRRVLYYMYNIIGPCVMLSALTLTQFWLPCESGEKVTLGLTVLLAYSVFSFNIGEKLPETSDVVPLIAIYITCIMAISSLSVGFSVVVLNIHHGGEVKQTPPSWLRFIAVRILAPIVCWRNSEIRMRRWLKMERNFYQTFRTMSTRVTEILSILPLAGTAQNVQQSPQPESTDDNGCSTSTFLTAPKAHIPTKEITEFHDGTRMVSDVIRKKSNVGLANVFVRTERILTKFERDLKSEQTAYEWRRIANIFDRFFFWIIASVTVAWALVMLAIAPCFSYRKIYE